MFATETLLDCGDWLLFGLFGPRAVVDHEVGRRPCLVDVSGLEKYEKLIWLSIDKPFERLLNF